MHSVERIFDQALSLGAQDIHILSKCAEKSLTFRSQRRTLGTAALKHNQWSELIEWLKFYSEYSAARTQEFQDCSCVYRNLSVRIAFSPYPHDYVVLRLHKTLNRPHCPYSTESKQFLELLAQKRGSICVLLGGLHSGKTTYYYDLLERYSQELKTLMSFEEPIEKPLESVVQLKYDSSKSSQYAASCLRYDIDYVGLGEARNSGDWSFLSFLGLSTINVLTTAHAKSMEEFVLKLRSYQKDVPHLGIDGVLMVENFSLTAGYIFDDLLSLRYRTLFCA